MLWVVLSLMTALAIGLAIMPFLRRPDAAPPRAAYDLEIYRDQLAEIDRDLTRGLLDDAQAEAARGEIGRRALAVSDEDSAAAPTSRMPRGVAIAGTLVPVMAVGLYLWGGSPRLPGAPAAERQIAHRDSGGSVVARLAEKMRQNPTDPKGWALLGRSYVSLRRFGDAAAAFGRAVALTPNDPDLLSRYGEALAFSTDGVVTPAARGALEAALKLDAKEPRARYYLGLADLQAGKRAEALARWRSLVADSGPDAPWMKFLSPRIEKLAAELGEGGAAPKSGPTKTAPKTPGKAAEAPARGPSAADVRASRSMSAKDRDAMIRSMVDGLAERLKDKPDDFAGWMRLGRSYGVLGETAKSRDAYGRAVTLKPKESGALSAYAAAMADATGGNLATAPKLPGVLERVLAADPDDRIGLWLSGALARINGEGATAAKHWRRLLPLVPTGSPQRAELEGLLKGLPPKGAK